MTVGVASIVGRMREEAALDTAGAALIGRPRVRRPGWRRVGLVLLAVVATAWGIAIWRHSGLSGLPDIGDPFDVAAFLDEEVADDANALVHYERAAGRLRGPGPLGPDGRPVLDWTRAGPEARARLETNRPALELWRRGTERAEALPKRFFSESPRELTDRILAQADFAQLAMLEATRSRAEGDVDGAWSWLRAALRSSSHFGRRTAHDPRIYASELVRLVTPTVLEWAVDPRVEAPLLRRALKDLEEIDALIGPDSEYYRVAFLLQMRAVEADARRPINFVGPEIVAGLRLPPSTNPAYARWKQEPERSRRVLRLLFANWLAQADKPPSRRGHAIFIKFPDPILYEAGPDDPPAAHALPPEEVARWYRSSMFAFFRYLGSDGKDYCRLSLDEEKAVRGRLRIALASQLDRRERGMMPASPREQVGEYLDELPEAVEGPSQTEPKQLLDMLRRRPR